MSNTWRQSTLALIPRTGLAKLAGLRGQSGISILLEADRVWVRWQAGDDEVRDTIHAIGSATLFLSRNREWYLPGGFLPHVVPDLSNPWVSLDRAIFPDRLHIESLPITRRDRYPLTLQRDPQIRPTTALRCRLSELAKWVDSAPTARIESVEAAYHEETVLLLGRSLPPLAHTERFWGGTVKQPLGYATHPRMLEESLHTLCTSLSTSIVWIDHVGVDVVPLKAFARLSRASVRLVERGRIPR